jgi:hypothetical protein
MYPEFVIMMTDLEEGTGGSSGSDKYGVTNRLLLSEFIRQRKVRR